MNHRHPVVVAAFLLALCALPAPCQEAATWQRPPQEILDVLHAPDLPVAWLDPTSRTMVFADRLRYPPIEELAAPMLKLAGVRINPRTNGPHVESAYTSLRLERVEDLRAGRPPREPLVTDARILGFAFSGDGARYAFARRQDDGIELHVGETAGGAPRLVPGVRLNPVLGDEMTWMPDGRTILIKRIPPGRGAAPGRPARPDGPNVQSSSGGTATSTYEARDVLTSAHDEALFEHHATSQLALVDATTLGVTDVGTSGVIARVAPSPDGSIVLVARVHQPFSRRHAWWRFPTDVEAWDPSGRVVQVLSRLPLADAVPIQGVPEGPRDHAWRIGAPATLTWVEAQDGGDWSRQVPHRDVVFEQASPFTSPPREIHRAVHRVRGLSWGERGDLLIVNEYERARRWRHAWALRPGNAASAPRKIFDLSVNDRYADPGTPVQRTLPSGHSAIVQDDDAIFLTGSGSTPTGDRPFLDRMDLPTLATERLFRSDADGYERFVDFIDVAAGTFVTRRESPDEVPNYHVRRLRGRATGAGAGEAMRRSTRAALTAFADPAPAIRGITRRIVTFERADGTPQSFTLCLPPGWVEGQRVPTILYAYPLEYSDPATAGQVAGTDRTFLRLAGASHLFLLLSGYAVLHDTTMPVVGDPDTAYDTFIEQLVASAKAAIDQAVAMGVADPDRLGVMGHSHGGLMTATLLAHSDLFRAGIARSGAYNHTMRPFGFQSERRTLWDAMDTYVRLSPVMHAPKIDEPILIIHGESDQNPGTVPLQSERLYEAVRGTGGTARLVMLPNEQHGYASREGVEHVLAEQLAWFDQWVKNAPPRD